MSMHFIHVSCHDYCVTLGGNKNICIERIALLIRDWSGIVKRAWVSGIDKPGFEF